MQANAQLIRSSGQSLATGGGCRHVLRHSCLEDERRILWHRRLPQWLAHLAVIPAISGAHFVRLLESCIEAACDSCIKSFDAGTLNGAYLTWIMINSQIIEDRHI